MPNTASVNTAVTTQQTTTAQNQADAVDFAQKMTQIIAARRLEETRSNLGF